MHNSSYALFYVPSLTASLSKQASMRPFSRDAWGDNSNNHNNTDRDMVIGALASGALPASSMARYELVDLPGIRRNIDRVIDRASRRGLIFATPQGHGRTNPLASHIQAGDVVLQAHGNDPFLKSVAQKDFGTLSSAASGSPLSHVGVTGAHGNVVDPGNKNLDKKSRSALIKKFLSDRSRWNAEGLRDLRRTIKNREFKPARRSYLDIINNFGTSAFWDDERGRSNASIIMTPKNPKGSPDRSMVDLKSTYYGKGGATQSGLRRLLLPVGSGKMDVHGKSNLKNGLFCSQGVCYSLGSRGVPTVDPSKSLPPDFLENDHLKLKGIGLNRHVMEEYADRIKDVRGEKAKLRKATKLLFSDLTRTAAKHRRILGGAVTGGMAGVGSLAGLLANKAVQYDPDDYVPEFMRRKALPL